MLYSTYFVLRQEENNAHELHLEPTNVRTWVHKIVFEEIVVYLELIYYTFIILIRRNVYI